MDCEDPPFRWVWSCTPFKEDYTMTHQTLYFFNF